MILPKKSDIDKSKLQEREQLVKEGILLATKVDKLRATSADEEKRLKDWRESSLKQVQLEIAEQIVNKNSLLGEIQTLEGRRQELLKPLDKEWEELKGAKDDLEQERQIIWEEKEFVKVEKQDLDKNTEKLSNLISNAKQNETDTQKAKDESRSLKELSQREYEMANTERITQSEDFDTKLSEVTQSKKEYEVALSLIKIRENEVKEKEVDIIKREQHLASQQVALRIASEVINKNATNKHNEV